jgi:ligand-binding sensor domain-containing protein/signal transduction histidine kinase/CheY-like chemotaxis protein
MRKIHFRRFYGFLLFFLTTIWLLIPLTKNILALDPNKAVSQYVQQIWQDELPQSTILAITQTNDGYMWFATYKGLLRFDGVRFTVFDQKYDKDLKTNNIHSLYEDQNNTLWIGTNQGLFYFKDGDFQAFTRNKELSESLVSVLYGGQNGDLWVGTNKGLFQIKNSQVKQYTAKSGLLSDTIFTICEDKKQNLWIGTSNGLNCFKGGDLSVYDDKEKHFNVAVRAICEDPLGNLWIGTDTGLKCLSSKGVRLYTTENGLTHNFILALRLDPQGFLWIGTPGGLSRLVGEKFSKYTNTDGLSNTRVRSMYQDREGSLWVGTNGGINRFSESKVVTYTTKEGLSSDYARSIFEDRNGNIWIGTDGGVTKISQDKTFIYSTKDGLADNSVRTICEDRNGNIWLGSIGGLTKFSDGKFTNYTKENGLSSNYVRAVYEDSSGNLWIGTEDGLNLFKDNKFAIYTKENGLSSNDIRVISEDKNGTLWFGTYDQGITCLKDNKFTTYTKENGLSENLIFSFYTDDEGVFWIGTDTGLVRFKDDKFFVYKTQETPNEEIFHILEDDKKNFWLSSNSGIYQISKVQLNDYADGKEVLISSTIYNKADGMKTAQCNGASQPAGWKTKAGKLWFPTAKGVVMIEPEAIKLNKVIPSVVIEQIIVDNQTIEIKNKVSFPAGKENFEIYYTALSFVAPEKVKIKYKLEGWDRDWINSDSLRRVTYTNLPPRDYEFKVMACNNDGFCNEVGASYSFNIKTPLSQTWWAYFGYVLVIAGLTYAVSRYRLETLKRSNRLLEAKVLERTVEIDQKNIQLAEKFSELKQAVEKIKFSEKQAIEAQHKAIEASKAKSIFLANMSHELRTPLNIILGFAQVLGRDKSFNESHRQTLTTIMRSGEHLLGLINDVLSIAKIEAGKLALNEQPFNLSQMLLDIENMIRVRAEAKSLKLKFFVPKDLPQTVIGDEGKLRQVLINLLGNAVKFTKEGSVTLEVFWQNNLVFFEITDTGPGMTKEETERAFNAFEQTQTGKSYQEGTGLGLTISRDFVSLMGGELLLVCEIGKGCKFSFQIKLPESKEVIQLETRRAIGLEDGQPQYKILVVDDVQQNCELLEILLSSLGFLIKQASNGLEALDVWQNWLPNIVLMDLQMPVMNGYEAAKQIRAKEEANQLSPCLIIAFTASVFDHTKESLLSNGINDIVVKPFREIEVLEKFTKHLSIKFKFEATEEVNLNNKNLPQEMKEDLFTKERFLALPKTLIDRLEHALVVGDNKMAQQIIEEVAAQDKGLADKMNKMVKNLQIDELLNILDDLC